MRSELPSSGHSWGHASFSWLLLNCWAASAHHGLAAPRRPRQSPREPCGGLHRTDSPCVWASGNSGTCPYTQPSPASSNAASKTSGIITKDRSAGSLSNRRKAPDFLPARTLPRKRRATRSVRWRDRRLGLLGRHRRVESRSDLWVRRATPADWAWLPRHARPRSGGWTHSERVAGRRGSRWRVRDPSPQKP
jgi:hypothetical protein